MNRRQLLASLGISGLALSLKGRTQSIASLTKPVNKPIVLSTWYNQSKTANLPAWKILSEGGSALDAVEAGVQVSENDPENCCVGLGANPDRDGIVTLDACIMDHKYQIGSVAALEQIKSPIHVARLVMEKTPHVMLVGVGAQQFAVQNGMELQGLELSFHAKRAYDEWLRKSEYKPVMNIEKGHGPYIAPGDEVNEYNHDTIGMIAMDKNGNLSGACTTSGMGFKMRGRIGDSPIIGAGLYVDNEVGAATATGQGEEVIRICGSFLVVEFMRQGMNPEQACKKAVERIRKNTPKDANTIQVGFIAINKKGENGGYALHRNFDYGVTDGNGETKKFDSKFMMQ